MTDAARDKRKTAKSSVDRFRCCLDEHQLLPGDDLHEGLTGHPALGQGAALRLQVVAVGTQQVGVGVGEVKVAAVESQPLAYHRPDCKLEVNPQALRGVQLAGGERRIVGGGHG
jgi:hypothetical protein